MNWKKMKMTILLPHKIFLKMDILKLAAEAEDGFFGILPNHIDFLSILVPGILAFETENGEKQYIAVDEGILVKKGPEVMISTRNAVMEKDLERLRDTVEEVFLNLDEKEKKARSAAAMMEAEFIRKFVQEQQM